MCLCICVFACVHGLCVCVYVHVCEEGFVYVGVPEVNFGHHSLGAIYFVLEIGSLVAWGSHVTETSWPLSSSSVILSDTTPNHLLWIV